MRFVGIKRTAWVPAKVALGLAYAGAVSLLVGAGLLGLGIGADRLGLGERMLTAVGTFAFLLFAVGTFASAGAVVLSIVLTLRWWTGTGRLARPTAWAFGIGLAGLCLDFFALGSFLVGI